MSISAYGYPLNPAYQTIARRLWKRHKVRIGERVKAILETGSGADHEIPLRTVDSNKLNLGILGITGTGILLFANTYWMPLFPLASGWTAVVAMVTTFLVQRSRGEQRILQRLLNLQMSEPVAAEIWKRRGELLTHGRLKPQALTATVVFIDLKGFTQRTESLAAEELLEWVNPFMAVATETILEWGGMVDDYFGDGIKANFGVPIPRGSDAEIARDADNALGCAMALVERLSQIDSQATAPYRLRVGIHSGRVMMATVGSRARLKYTSVGDAVNVAARLEAVAKEVDSSTQSSCIVASTATLQLVGKRAPWQDLGDVSLKGRAQPVKAHALLMAT